MAASSHCPSPPAPKIATVISTYISSRRRRRLRHAFGTSSTAPAATAKRYAPRSRDAGPCIQLMMTPTSSASPAAAVVSCRRWRAHQARAAPRDDPPAWLAGRSARRSDAASAPDRVSRDHGPRSSCRGSDRTPALARPARLPSPRARRPPRSGNPAREPPANSGLDPSPTCSFDILARAPHAPRIIAQARATRLPDPAHALDGNQ